MANSKLEHTIHELPENIIDHLKKTLYFYNSKSHVDGYKRSKNLIETGQIGYKALERLKHEFDNVLSEEETPLEYVLNGGEAMKIWVNNKLNALRNGIETTKIAKTNAGIGNQYRDENGSMTNIMPNIPRLPGGEGNKNLAYNARLMQENKIFELMYGSNYKSLIK
jgi:hypothetical protein